MIGKRFLKSVAKKAINVGEEISQEASVVNYTSEKSDRLINQAFVLHHLKRSSRFYF